jgi:hypothetical protein
MFDWRAGQTTIDFWLLLDSFTNPLLVGWLNPPGFLPFYFGVSATGHPIVYAWTGAATYFTCSSTVALNVWHHLAFTSTSATNQAVIYLDGTSCATGTFGASFQSTAGVAFAIGIQNVASQYSNGYLAGLRVARALLYIGNFVPQFPLPVPASSALLSLQVLHPMSVSTAFANVSSTQVSQATVTATGSGFRAWLANPSGVAWLTSAASLCTGISASATTLVLTCPITSWWVPTTLSISAFTQSVSTTVEITPTSLGLATGTTLSWGSQLYFTAPQIMQQGGVTLEFILPNGNAIAVCVINSIAGSQIGCVIQVWSSTVSVPVATSPKLSYTVSGSMRVLYLSDIVTLIPAVLSSVRLGEPMSSSSMGQDILTGGSSIYIGLPIAVPSLGDWQATNVTWNPLNIPSSSIRDEVAVWVNNSLCAAVDVAGSLVSCALPPLDGLGSNVSVVVQIARQWNSTGTLLAPSSPSAITSSNPAVILLPGKFAKSPLVNITLAGSGLVHPVWNNLRISQVTVGNTSCSSIRVVAFTSIMCAGWNASSVVDKSKPLTVSYMWNGQVLTASVTIPVITRPILLTVQPPVVAAAGTIITAVAQYLSDAMWSMEFPSLLIGGLPCNNVSIFSAVAISCLAPEIPVTAVGYPKLQVEVISASGAISTEAVFVTYPSRFDVAWHVGTTTFLPATDSSTLLASSNAGLTAVLYSRDAATCTVTLNTSTAYQARASIPTPFDQPPTWNLVGTTALTVAGNATDAYLLSFQPLGLLGPSGTRVNVSVSCTDLTTGRRTSSDSNVAVQLPAWQLQWNGTLDELVHVPVALPVHSAIWSIMDECAPMTIADAPSWLSLASCTAVLTSGTTYVLGSLSLTRISSAVVISASTGVLSVLNASALGVEWSGLDASSCTIGSYYTLHAECIWVPTGERWRLPSRAITIPSVTGVVEASASAWCNTASAASGICIDGYRPVVLAGKLSFSSISNVSGALDGVSFGSSAAVCSVQLGTSAYSTMRLSDSTAALHVSVQTDGTATPSSFDVVVEGLPSQVGNIHLVCTVWGQIIRSSPLPFTINAFRVYLESPGLDAYPLYILPTFTNGMETISSEAVASQLIVRPHVAVLSQSYGSLTCSASIWTSVSPSVGFTSYNQGYLATTVRAQLIGTTTVTSEGAIPAENFTTSLTFMDLGLRAASGSAAIINVTCRDGASRSGATNTSVTLHIPAFIGGWSIATEKMQQLQALSPETVPDLSLNITTESCVEGFHNTLPLWSCIAVLQDAAITISTSVALASSVRTGVVEAALFATEDHCVLRGGFTGIDASSTTLGGRYKIHAECTWQPTSEQIRLTPLDITTATASVAVSATSQELLAFTDDHSLTASVITNTQYGLSGTCVLQAVNSSGTLAVSEAALSAVYTVETDGTLYPRRIYTQLNGPPGQVVFALLACKVWNGHTITSIPLRLTSTLLSTGFVGAQPTAFIPSDMSSPWPVLGVSVAVTAEIVRTRIRNVTCTLTPTDAAAAQVRAASLGSSSTNVSSQLQVSASSDDTGVVIFPPVIIQTTFDNAFVQLAIACTRDTSDAPPDLQLTLQLQSLRLVVCTSPAATSPLLSPLPVFSFGIAAAAGSSLASFDDPCASAVMAQALPQIACSITYAESGSSNSSSSVFLQRATAVMDRTTHIITYPDFTLTAPQDNTYALLATCSIGAVVIPSPYAFQVAMSGCPTGMAPSGVTCAECRAGTFSLGGAGASCIGCPSAGVQCNSGILTLLPRYYQPPSQAHSSIGPNTELHPCYNAEACTLNASSFAYGCSTGYTGPLCSVCDQEDGYARFGSACSVCWSPYLSGLFIAIIILVVLALLTRVALRQVQQRSDASVVLRITMSFLQAVGSLRAFTAGGTRVFHDVMGWTDNVSASPLSVGALQCVVPMPYLLQYIATISLPLLAALAVVCIFMLATSIRAVRCTPRLSFAAQEWRERLQVWWSGKRHWATLWFVLFLAYMPITSASLRALDCYPDTIDGVTYLKIDMRVQCYVGAHAVARAIAYCMLVCVGLGFPLGLAYLLGTATPDELQGDAFHNTWGFLFDGYRIPNASQVVRKPRASATLLMGAVTNAFAKRGSILTQAPQPTEGLSWQSPSSNRGAANIQWCKRLRCLVGAGNLVGWESIVLIRKAGVVLLALLVTNPYVQCVGVSLWFLVFLQLQLHYQPYTKTLFNRLEALSLTTSLVTALVSTSLLQFNVVSSAAELHDASVLSPLEWATTTIMLVINLATVATLVGCWCWLQCRAVTTMVKRVSLRMNGKSRHWAVGNSKGNILSTEASPNPSGDKHSIHVQAGNAMRLKPATQAKVLTDGDLSPFTVSAAMSVSEPQAYVFNPLGANLNCGVAGMNPAARQQVTAPSTNDDTVALAPRLIATKKRTVLSSA